GRAPAEIIEHADDGRIDLVVEHVLDDRDALRVGHAKAVDELRLQPRLAHAVGDRLSTAVDEHRIDADGFEKNNVTQKPLDDALVLHRAAAVLDYEELATEPLDVRQRLDESFGALDGSLSHEEKAKG